MVSPITGAGWCRCRAHPIRELRVEGHTQIPIETRHICAESSLHITPNCRNSRNQSLHHEGSALVPGLGLKRTADTATACHLRLTFAALISPYRLLRSLQTVRACSFAA